jgi:uncharacterized membrane protein YcaP (DUF421 family)
METVIRATVVYIALWGLVRGLGKRELAELSPFDLILLIVLGDMVQQGITQEDTSVTGALLAVGTLAFWVIVSSFVTWKWRGSRRVIAGTPVVVVQDGRLLEDSLRYERLPAEEVLEAARAQGIGDLADVKIAVLEPTGTISFIKAG